MLNTQTVKCRFCEIIESPRAYFDWVYYQDEDCVMGDRGGSDTLLVYSKHGELPGGRKLNTMMIRIGSIMDKKTEYLQYVDGEHYRIWVRKKGE